MAGLHLLDRIIGSEYPSFVTDAEVRGFEEVPYADRIAAASTYDALRLVRPTIPMRLRSSTYRMRTRPTPRSSSATAISSRA